MLLYVNIDLLTYTIQILIITFSKINNKWWFWKDMLLNIPGQYVANTQYKHLQCPNNQI